MIKRTIISYYNLIILKYNLINIHTTYYSFIYLFVIYISKIYLNKLLNYKPKLNNLTINKLNKNYNRKFNKPIFN